MKIADFDALNDARRSGLMKLLHDGPRIGVGLGTCGIGNGAQAVYQAIQTELKQAGQPATVAPVGCFGYCAVEPLVNVYLPGQPLVILAEVTPDDAAYIVAEVQAGRMPTRKALCRIEAWDHLTGQVQFGQGLNEIPLWNEIPFFVGQQKLVLRNCGLINPDDIEEYMAIGGYQALYQALHKPQPEEVIEEINKAKLRGRGGAGYPTAVKWKLLREASADQKYVICNADEGDPGAYMNRNEIESDPHMLLEGMLIGAYATGASEGIVYLRAEYPLAVERLKRAVAQATEYGLLGESVLGTDFAFKVRLIEGAGAFVCGEETAMVASLEGHAGRPRPRPPFPAEAGLWGKPTNINNVETWCNVPVILAKGGAWFAGVGTPTSSGTKVFSLVGKIKHTGLVEMPLGAPLKNIIYGIGGGSAVGKTIKAVQTGGPSGGCIPAKHFDTAVDYESLGALGAIMGSGGMVVMDDDNCMVDVARYFVEFTHAESCGKCIPCRVGLDEMLRILRRITEGQADHADLDKLQELAHMIRDTSLCGLGQTAPNPVLTTLRYFRDEYEDHIRAKRCAAGVCEALYLSPCENSCPLHMRIPAFLQLMKEDRLDDAAEMIWLDNPLPASTGRICQHPCEGRCRRGEEDAPVNMREVHRYIADTILDGDRLQTVQERLLRDKLPATGKRVAVVGAGPSGLSAAFYMTMLGHAVTVYEEREAAGGMLRYCLPEYRLPDKVLDAELSVLTQVGVEFEFNQSLGAGLSLDRLDKEYDMVFLATGTWNETHAGFSGEQAPNVWHAVAFLEQVARGKPPLIGEQVVVIGGGNAAVDSARTAVRLGAKVTIVYRRERKDMPAIAEEVEDAEEEGVEIVFLASPQRAVLDELGQAKAIELRRTVLGEFDSSGRRTPVSTDDFFTLPCSAIVVAAGEKPDPDPLRRAGIRGRDNFTAAVDSVTYATNMPHVHAGGDLVTGASNVSATMGTGKYAARAMDTLLMGASDRFTRMLKTFTYENVVPLEPEGGVRNVSPRLEPDTRRTNFAEVMEGDDATMTVRESCRCLRCDVRETCAVADAAVEKESVSHE